MAKRENNDLRAKIIANLDVCEEYKIMGLRFSGEPLAGGSISAYAIDREDNKPSAYVYLESGIYGDSGSDSKPLSFWNFAIRFGGYKNFGVALKHFAAKAGVELTRQQRSKNSKDPTERLLFEDWNAGNERLAEYWCARHKKGTSVDALKAAGARVGYHHCFATEGGKKRRVRLKVLAVPAYGPKLTAATPVAYQLFRINGQFFEVWSDRDEQPSQIKCKSVGPTSGALVNRHALEILAGDRSKIEVIWRVSGPSDLLSMLSAIPPELRDSHLVVSGASGEKGRIAGWNTKLHSSLKTYICLDADKIGEDGAVDAVQAYLPRASEVRHVRLPYEITKNHGRGPVIVFVSGVQGTSFAG